MIKHIFLFVIAGIFSVISIGYSALQKDLMVSGDVLKIESNSGGLAREYDGTHQDTVSGPGNQAIYYWYATNDPEGTQIQNKNNVVFAGHCWQMIINRKSKKKLAIQK